MSPALPKLRKLQVRNNLISFVLVCLARLALGLATLLSIPTFAATTVDGADKRQIEVAISAKEENLLVISGRRVSDVSTRKGVLGHRPDNVTGIHHFIVQSDDPQTISMFVTDDADVRYQLLLVPKPIPAQEIILRPPTSGPFKASQASSDGAGTSNNTMPYQRRVKSFLLGIADDNSADAYSPAPVNQDVPLWKEAKLRFIAQYRDSELVGERYELTNMTMEPLTIVEQELMRPGVLAILLNEHVLSPGAVTSLFIVRTRSSHER